MSFQPTVHTLKKKKGKVKHSGENSTGKQDESDCLFYTSTFWFGFDRPGQSLGLQITGATLAGFAWGDYMREIHTNLIAKDFPKPLEGVIEATVCSVSGQLPTANCQSHLTTQWYLEGTQPTSVCTVHSSNTSSFISIARLRNEMYKSGQHLTEKPDYSPLKLNLDFLKPGYENTVKASESVKEEEEKEINFDYNYLME